jgi:hypothetical protein
MGFNPIGAITGGIKGAVDGLTGGGGSGGGSGAGDLQAIFDKAAADRKEFTEISVKGNTEIAKFNEKPKI